MHDRQRWVGDWWLLPDQHGIRHRDTQQVQELGAQNYALLQYLYEHPQQVLSREQLLNDVWQGITVNDNTLSKAIADLRKALGDDSKQARYIVTLPKRGYRLIAPVGDANRTIGPVSVVTSKSRRVAMALAFSALVLLFVLWRWLTPPVEMTGLQLRPFTSDAGLEVSPSFSFDGQWLAYVAYPAGSSRAQLQLRTLSGDASYTVLMHDGEIETPTWSTRDWRLAYLQRSGDRCDVVIATFDRDTHRLRDSRLIAVCAPPSRLGFTSLQWRADGNAVYYYRRNERGGTELVSHDWQRDQIDVITAHGSYAFAVHPHNNDLVTADVSVMSSSLTSHYGDELKTLYSRPELFLGVQWDVTHDALVISSGLAGGRLERITREGDATLLYTSTSPLMQATVSPVSPTIAASQVIVKHDLWIDSLSKSAARTLIASTHFDYSPQFSHSGNHLVFISNRSGKPEVWRGLRDGSEQQRLLSLPDEQWPVNVQWSSDDRFLAIGSSAQMIWRFDVASNTLERMTPVGTHAINPRWSLDGKQIFYASFDGDEGRIQRVDVNSKQISDSGLEGALYVPALDGQSAYLLRYGNSDVRGVWRLQLESGEQQRILPPLDRFNWQNFSPSAQGFYFMQVDAGGWQVRHWQADRIDTRYTIPANLAGPLFIDFAVDPTQTDIVFTRVEDIQSDIVLLQ